MDKKEADIAKILLNSLNKAEFKSLSGPELVQYAQSYQWLANKIKEVENPPPTLVPTPPQDNKVVPLKEPKR